MPFGQEPTFTENDLRLGMPITSAALPAQTASKFPFRWWGANSTLSDRHQLDEPPVPHSAQNEALNVPESRYANSRGYTDLVRSASFPTRVNGILARFGPAAGTGRRRLEDPAGWARFRIDQYVQICAAGREEMEDPQVIGVAQFSAVCSGVSAQTTSEQTLLGKSRRSISKAGGGHLTRGMYSVSLAFERYICDRFSAPFDLTLQRHLTYFPA
jgi:hypothetical protein